MDDFIHQFFHIPRRRSLIIRSKARGLTLLQEGLRRSQAREISVNAQRCERMPIFISKDSGSAAQVMAIDNSGVVWDDDRVTTAVRFGCGHDSCEAFVLLRPAKHRATNAST